MSAADPVNDAPGRCGAKTRSGGPCKLPAGHGTGHQGTGRCRRHGGSSPNAEKAGALELARREAAVMGLPTEIDPHEAMLRCLAIVNGELIYMTERVAELDDATVKTMFGPQLHMWVTARQATMDRLVLYSKIALAAGVEERRVRATEEVASRFAQAVTAIVRGLGLDPADPGVREVVRRELTVIAGGGT